MVLDAITFAITWPGSGNAKTRKTTLPCSATRTEYVAAFRRAHRTGGKAGIREKQPHRSRGIGRSAQRQAAALSFHSLRRTATTLLHEAGVPAAVVQSLIGHDSEEVHQLYVAVGKEALASAAARLPDLV